MPILKASKKGQRQNVARRKHNVVIRQTLKDTLKTASEKNLDKVFSVVDKAAKRHIIHKNKAARIKSRLSKKFGGKEVKKAVETKKTKVAKETKTTKKVKK